MLDGIILYHTLTYMHLLFQASNAVGVLCQNEETHEVAKEMFSQIFSTLILRIGVSVVVESSKKPLCVK